MVNRVLQAKAMKLRRQLLKLPRRYEEIPFEHGAEAPGKQKIRSTLKVEVIESYSQRCQGLKISATEMADIERNQRFHGVSPGRHEVNQRLLTEVDIHVNNRLVVLETGKVKVWAEFNAQRTQWRIIEFNKVLSKRRVSKIYPTKQRAVFFYTRKTVMWMQP